MLTIRIGHSLAPQLEELYTAISEATTACRMTAEIGIDKFHQIGKGVGLGSILDSLRDSQDKVVLEVHPDVLKNEQEMKSIIQVGKGILEFGCEVIFRCG